MDAELLKTFLRQAQKGEHIRRVMAMSEWPSLKKLIEEHRDQYDTVRGIRADKEFIIRQSKVEAIDELLGTLDSIYAETETALEELNTRDEYDA